MNLYTHAPTGSELVLRSKQCHNMPWLFSKCYVFTGFFFVLHVHMLHDSRYSVSAFPCTRICTIYINNYGIHAA